jgi:hypothetical protein
LTESVASFEFRVRRLLPVLVDEALEVLSSLVRIEFLAFVPMAGSMVGRRKKGPRRPVVAGEMVERMRIELTTSALRTRRSPS